MIQCLIASRQAIIQKPKLLTDCSAYMRGLGSFLSPKERHLIFSYQRLIRTKKGKAKRSNFDLQLREVADYVLTKSAFFFLAFHALIVA